MASAQLLQNPTVDSKQSFERSWLRYYDDVKNWRSMNRALLCDPANSKKKTSDYTTMAVMDLLRAADAQATGGILYNGNAVKRAKAKNVFAAM